MKLNFRKGDDKLFNYLYNILYRRKIMDNFFTEQMLKQMHKEVPKFLNFYGFWCDQIYKNNENTCTVLVGDQTILRFAMFNALIKERLASSIDEGWTISYDEQGALTITSKTTGVKNTIITEHTLKSPYKLSPDVKYKLVKDIDTHGAFDLENVRKEITSRFLPKTPDVSTMTYYYPISVGCNLLGRPFIQCATANPPDEYYAMIRQIYPIEGALISRCRYLSNCQNVICLPHTPFNNTKLQQNVEKQDFEEQLNQLKDNDALYVKRLTTIPPSIQSYMLVEKQINLLGHEYVKCAVLNYSEKTKMLSFEPVVLIDNEKFRDILSDLTIYLKTIPAGIKKSLPVASSLPFDILGAVATASYGKYFLEKYMPKFKGVDDPLDILSFTYGKEVRKELLDESNYQNVQDKKNRILSANLDSGYDALETPEGTGEISKRVDALRIRAAIDEGYFVPADYGEHLRLCVRNMENLAELMGLINMKFAKIETCVKNGVYSQKLNYDDLVNTDMLVRGGKPRVLWVSNDVKDYEKPEKVKSDFFDKELS